MDLFLNPSHLTHVRQESRQDPSEGVFPSRRGDRAPHRVELVVLVLQGVAFDAKGAVGDDVARVPREDVLHLQLDHLVLIEEEVVDEILGGL